MLSDNLIKWTVFKEIIEIRTKQTLEKRQFSKQLEAVHKGVGKIQNLAVSVGDLKKVMSNVK